MLIGQYFRYTYTYRVYNDLIEKQELINEFVINEFNFNQNQKLVLLNEILNNLKKYSFFIKCKI